MFKFWLLIIYIIRNTVQEVAEITDLTDCPSNRGLAADKGDLLSKEQLGHLVWTIMHTYSAHVPENPSPEERFEISTLIRLL